MCQTCIGDGRLLQIEMRNMRKRFDGCLRLVKPMTPTWPAPMIGDGTVLPGISFERRLTVSKSFVSLVLALTVAATGSAFGDTLSVGDAAPKLAVKEFVKGEPVKSLQKGKTHV